MRKFIWLLFIILCFGWGQANPSRGIYYEIFVRSFQDTTGDGIGDLQGVISRLDYLEELGINGIWLMPIHPSPSYHGYDVTDYYNIHPDYGTLDDFQELIAAAGERGIDIVMDLVVNHTSDQHPWFIQSSRGDPDYRDYYLWSDEDLGWRGVSGAPAWHRSDSGYYLGLFWGGMPDLNFRNPEVEREMNTIARYWLEMGVTGFRIDAIQHIVESETGNIRNTPETFAWVRRFQDFVHSVNPDAFVVGETWTDTESIIRYHTQGNLDMSFNYPLWNTVLSGLQSRSASDLAFMLAQDERLYPATAERAIFISNHDQIRPATTLSPLRRDLPRLKLAAGLLLTLPGTPFLYYGEEIGMPNGPGERDEEKRTPMLWDDSDNFGFTTGTPWYAFSTTDASLSVAAQQADPDSLLNWYQTLIQLRQATPALRDGTTEILSSPERAVLSFIRSDGDTRVQVLANLSNNDHTLPLAAPGVDMVSGDGLEAELTLERLTLRVIALDTSE
jgi:alpha-amylase